MKLGFYYHISLVNTEKELRMPAYLGLFIDAVCQEVESLTLFMHEEKLTDSSLCDYVIKANNIRFVSLGVKTPAWQRFLFPKLTLRKLKSEIKLCDAMIVRAPSPLAPAFYKEFSGLTKVIYMVVGDYQEGVKYLTLPFLKKTMIGLLSRRNDYQLTQKIKKTCALVNSTALYEKYEAIAYDLHEIRTTTLSSNDFFVRNDTCQRSEIQVLYTGRIDLSKGLLELTEAVSRLIKKGLNLQLNYVGWEDNRDKPIQKLLTERAVQLNISDKVLFHGKKIPGEELNKMYRESDIYVIPSYHEGFPRTIWEAMANSLPVIATKVGSIPYLLEDRLDALLINPKNTREIESAISTVISDKILRENIIKNGFLKAQENTLERQTKLFVDKIKKYSIKL